MLLGILPSSSPSSINARPAAHTNSQGPHDPIAASGIPMNSNGGARKTKVSTGTLGSPFNQQNNPSGIPASAHATAIANAANHAKAPTHKGGRDKDKDRKEKAIRQAVAAQQKQRDHQQHQRKTSKQSQQFAFPQTSTANSSTTALPNNNDKNATKAAPGSARKAPPPVSGTNNPLNMSLTASGTRSVAQNGLRRRTSSSASDRSIKKDDLLDRLAQALKWVVFTFVWILYI